MVCSMAIFQDWYNEAGACTIAAIHADAAAAHRAQRSWGSVFRKRGLPLPLSGLHPDLEGAGLMLQQENPPN